MFVDVVLPIAQPRAFTYALPAEFSAAAVGARVSVPFRAGDKIGIVHAIHDTPPTGIRCKPIHTLCDDAPVLQPALRQLCQWVSDYYAAPLGLVYQSALPPALWKVKKREGKSRLPAPHRAASTFAPSSPVTLTAEQAAAVAQCRPALAAPSFFPALLHGITGSGKTEVYIQLMRETLALGRQVILLLPEIGLVPQMLSRLAHMFPDTIAVAHSGLTETQRIEQWQRMARGEAHICCGTRSAIFAPLTNVGLIIVDEEHDPAYKQEECPSYHGRDVAVVRAQQAGIPVILGTATPALETYANVMQQRYRHLPLTVRPQGTALPTVELINLREHPASHDSSGELTEPLRIALADTLARGEQSILFLNRRGFSPLLQCSACAHFFTCPHCTMSLTLHRAQATLRCHHCDYHMPRPNQCPSCADEFLKAVGSGTERIEDALRTHFPTARIARFDRDTTGPREERDRALTAMQRGEIDILLGTQMLTKGHDFPGVTLVGIINADLSLHLPDFRAAERTFQLVTQVAGRAGRREHRGRVLIQTLQPEHYALRAATQHDFTQFAEEELRYRQDVGFPPYTRLLNVRLRGKQLDSVTAFAQQLAKHLRQSNHAPHCHILGPAPAPLALVANVHRWQLLIKSGSPKLLQHIVRQISASPAVTQQRAVHVTFDMDPQQLL